MREERAKKVLRQEITRFSEHACNKIIWSFVLWTYLRVATRTRIMEREERMICGRILLVNMRARSRIIQLFFPRRCAEEKRNAALNILRNDQPEME